MSEENDKNPLEIFLEKMDELLSLQVEQNKKLQSNINEYQILMSKIGQEHLINQEEFKNLSEKLPQEILRIHKQCLNVMNNHSIRVERNVKGLDMQIYNAIEKATKSVSGIELSLNEKDRQSLKNTETQIKRFNKLFLLVGGIIIISTISFLGSAFLAKEWYDTSVQTKQEVRKELLEEIRINGDVITSKTYLIALENEKELLNGWVRANPEDSKSYKTHRKAVVNLDGNREQLFFETPTSMEIRNGGEKDFFD